MKKLLFFAFFLSALFCSSQKYSEVVEIPGKTADQLYAKANEWFALTFKSANDVIQLNDPAEKKIIGKGVKRISYPDGRNQSELQLNMYFTLMVQFKDGKYRYEIQSSEFSPLLGSEKYSYEMLQYMTTPEGVTENLKNKGVVPWGISKKQIELAAKSNKNATIEAENQLHNIISDLTASLGQKAEDNNW